MVRGNWQRRVEKTEARRHEAKAKKQKNEERRLTKSKLNELLSMMDRNKDSILSQSDGKGWEIHVWTDTVHADSPPLLDMMYDDDRIVGGGVKSSGRKGRNRSDTIESEGSASGGGRGRKPSTHGGKKKAHPRSKDANVEDEMQTPVAPPRLCRHQFFKGKCTQQSSGGKKGGGCRHVHYPKTLKTIYQVMSSGADDTAPAVDVLKQCQDAHPDTQDEESDSGSMEMLYYFTINLDQEISSISGEDSSTPTFSDIVGGAMAKKSCGLGSIIYVALNENLVFDRYRDGIVISETELLTSVGGLNVGTSGSFSMKLEKDKATSLPGSVLEYVLQFLPDSAVASMTSVCRSWNLEIGKQSVYLWKHLLERRSWPLPSDEDTDEESLTNDAFRKEFLAHYSTLRDVNGLKLAMSGLLTKQPVQEKEACFRSFEHFRGSPQIPDTCISVEVWSSNRILVAYAQDCTLRMFDSVKKSGSSNERLCRELLCVCLDPYKNTKKRNCEIVGLALDDDWIGSLFQVVEGSTKREATLLRVVGREDFLLTDGSIEEELVKTIDVTQSILNYLLSCDEVDHGVLQLNDFLANGGDFDDVEVLVSHSVAACGHGRFLIEASISVPLLDGTDDDGSDVNMTQLFRKLFLISSGAGAIVWMCSSDLPNRPMMPRSQQLTLTSRKESADARSWQVITSWPSALAITSWSVGSGGDFHLPMLLEGSDRESSDILDDSWELRPTRHRPMISLSNQVVVADTYMRDIDENGSKEFKAVLSFYLYDSEGSNSLCGRVQLDNNWEISGLALLREKNILVIGRRYITNSDDTELGGIDGQWFGGRSGGHVSLYGIVIHSDSRTEISRTCLVEDLESCLDSDIATSGELPFKVAALADTMGAAAWWKGIVLTGHDVRLALESSQGADSDAQTPSPQKKKKKKTPKKGGKKDGFARGMSMRG